MVWKMTVLWGPHSTGALLLKYLLFGKLAQEKYIIDYSRKVLSGYPFDSEMVVSGAGI